jgi:UDPglucose 6-dehydrogenase
MKLSIIGTGKLGSSMVAYYASKGHSVVAIDNNIELIEDFNNGLCPVQETNLKETLDKCQFNVKFTTSYESAKETDITFIIVPTPTDDSGEFTNEYIVNVLKRLCLVLRDKKSYHLIVITSTVKLYSMRTEFAPLVESLMERKVNDGYGLVYNPEFIALGSVIHDLSNPDTILVGESDDKAGKLLEQFYIMTCENRPVIHRMSWENAEVAKMMLNVFVTMKISLANTFTEVCDKIVGGDIDKVTNFLGDDTRIGKKYLKGGLGYSGPCFPRDCKAFAKMGERIGLYLDLPVINDAFNKEHNNRVVKNAMKLLPSGTCRVSLLGVAYKPNTPLSTESSAHDLVTTLKLFGHEVLAYDPMAKIENVKMVGSIEECLKDSDLAIIVTQWKQFSSLKPKDFKIMRNPYIYDCWRMLNRRCFINSGVKYKALGVNE